MDGSSLGRKKTPADLRAAETSNARSDAPGVIPPAPKNSPASRGRTRPIRTTRDAKARKARTRRRRSPSINPLANPLRPPDDFYPTPRRAVEALLSRVAFKGGILEPACGDGAVARVLKRAGLSTTAADINDHGYGTAGIDFLVPGEVEKAFPHRRFSNVVTNPPYRLAARFARRALALTAAAGPEGKVALLLRLQFLEGERRADLFDRAPLSRVLVFRKRLTMYPANWDGEKGISTMAFAWFVWEHGHKGPAALNWI